MDLCFVQLHRRMMKDSAHGKVLFTRDCKEYSNHKLSRRKVGQCHEAFAMISVHSKLIRTPKYKCNTRRAMSLLRLTSEIKLIIKRTTQLRTKMTQRVSLSSSDQVL